jgi:RNA polymerase primary sigma factor
MTVAESCARRSSTEGRPNEAVRQRIIDLLRNEVRFVPNGSFFHIDEATEERMLTDVELDEVKEISSPPARGIPAHLARICESKPLSADTERELFFRKNYLQFRANVLRSRLDPNRSDTESVERIERLLRAAQLVRDRILRANTRLVVSVIKKFVTPHHSFDELLSEGLGSLMRAIEKFDYDRGFRFSTYAYRIISRHSSRTIADRQRRATRFVTGSDASTFEARAGVSQSRAAEKAQIRLSTELHHLITRLDRRDRFIIRCRYALGSHRKVKSCQFLADKLGLSKERVRQLEHRAVARLRAMASQHQLHELAEAVIH